MGSFVFEIGDFLRFFFPAPYAACQYDCPAVILLPVKRMSGGQTYLFILWG
jgi:hypothetical protein